MILGNTSGWVYLAVAVVLEVVATTFLKLSDGFQNLAYAGLSIVFYSIAFFFLAPALKLLPVGVVYAVWSGIGIVAIAIIGALYFAERLDLIQYAYIILILTGAVGLQLTTGNSHG